MPLGLDFSQSFLARLIDAVFILPEKFTELPKLIRAGRKWRAPTANEIWSRHLKVGFHSPDCNTDANSPH
jgi:hypothetical protein